MEHEILTSIRAVGYGQYNMVVYSTKIDEYGELIPYRQMVLAKRKSSEVLVERNVIRQAYSNVNYEHQGHNMAHLIRDYETVNHNAYLKNTEFVIIKVKPAIVEGIHRFEILDKNAKNKPEAKGANDKKKLKMSLGKSKVEVNPDVEIGVYSGGKNTPTGNLH